MNIFLSNLLIFDYLVDFFGGYPVQEAFLRVKVWQNNLFILEYRTLLS